MGDRQSMVVLTESEWVVPKVGDWVTDSKGTVWQVTNQRKDNKVGVRRLNSVGNKYRSFKDMSTLNKVVPAMQKLLSDSIKFKGE